jgi:hypothetical protein
MRDILKAKFATKGLVLKDDGSLYRGDELIAQNVTITDDGFDCISFNFDLLVDNVDFGMPIHAIPHTLH